MTFPPSPYTTKARVRLEAGRITSTVDLPDPDLDAIILSADRFIDDKTDVEGIGWQGSEVKYPIVQEVSALISASLARRRFGDPEGKAQQQWDAGIALLKEIIGEEGDSEIVFVQADFETFPKNPKALWSRGRYDTNAINPEIAIDPDIIYEGSD